MIVADRSLEAVQAKIKEYAHVEASIFDIADKNATAQLIARADIVVSLLPAMFQSEVASHCLTQNKHFLSASYLPEAIKAMDKEAREKNLLFLNELGLDPGLDHLSAMKILDDLRKEGAEITSFKSFCGALLAPESANNPWKYKFTWNPRNVVLAGQGGTAQYKEQGRLKFIPFYRLFEEIEAIEVEGAGKFEGYANRDSLGYAVPYSLENVPTLLRGTLRYAGYCGAWHVLVRLGLTDNSFQMNVEGLTYQDFTKSFLPTNMQIADLPALFGAENVGKLAWLGLFSDKPLKRTQGSPAEILQDLLEEKWALQPEDRDLVVMQHQIEFTRAGKVGKIISDLVLEGESATKTAIAKTVGLPLAMATKLLAEGKLSLRGVCLPIYPELYNTLLPELENFGICFKEKEI
jgi:saccharopine dehydrogenase (NADP+, L-glutamate forming)